MHPQGGEKNGPNLQGKFVDAPRQKVHPRGSARVQFLKKLGEIWAVGETI